MKQGQMMKRRQTVKQTVHSGRRDRVVFQALKDVLEEKAVMTYR